MNGVSEGQGGGWVGGRRRSGHRHDRERRLFKERNLYVKVLWSNLPARKGTSLLCRLLPYRGLGIWGIILGSGSVD